VFVISLFSSGDPERGRVKSAIAQLASSASPDAATLLLDAGGVVDNLLRRFPHSSDALNVVAQLYNRLDNTKGAIRCWQRCIQLESGIGPSYHAAIGSVEFENGRFDSASEHFRMAVEQDPAATVYQVQLAEALVNQGKLEEAVEVLENNLKARQGSVPTSVLLGQTYLQLRQYDKARQHLEMGVKRGADYTNVYYGLATACAKLGDQEKSKEYLKKFKELQAEKAQRHREALKTSDDVAKIRETVAATYANAAQVYVAHGDVQTGEAFLLRAKQLSPEGAECRIDLAWLYEQQGRTDEALKTLAEVSERASGNLSAQMSIASAYSRLKRFDEAEDAYRKAIELTPLQATGYAALANFCLQAGRKLPEARSLAQKAVELEPTAQYYFLLSLICQRNGDLADASSALDQAIALDPDNKGYQRLRQEFRWLTQPKTSKK